MKTTHLPFFSLDVTHNGKSVLKRNLEKNEFHILETLLMPSYHIRRTTRPYNYSTSILMLDNTTRIPLRINQAIWFKYRDYNRKVGLERTDCSIIREFITAFQNFNHRMPSQEILRYFVECVIKVKPQTTLFRFEDVTEQEQADKSFIDNHTIHIYPTIRKKPAPI